MPSATWVLSVENLVTGGTFTDISSYLQTATWSLGFASPYDPVARESNLEVVLSNTDQRFSPAITDGPYGSNLKPGQVIKLQSTYDSTTRDMFIGWLGAIQPSSGLSPDVTTITAQGWMSRAMSAPVAIPVAENTTCDAVVDTVLDTSGIYPPGTSLWSLGTAGLSELGQTTRLGSTASFFVAETGKSTFTFAGDDFTENTTVWGAIQNLCGREYGRLYVDRAGTINFINRHHLVSDLSTDFTFTNNFSELDYSFGDPDDMANAVSVKARTRRETSGAVVAGLQDPVAIPGSGSVDITYVLTTQDAGSAVAVKSPTPPVQTTDFLVNSSEDGTGTNLTSSVTASIPAATSFATRVTVTYTNASASAGYVLAGAQLRGTKLDNWAVVEAKQTDTDSVAAYGRREFAWPYAMDNLDTAESIAEFILLERAEPRNRVRHIAFKPNSSDALLTAALSYSIFDRIAVTETQSGLSSDPYFLITETHQITPADYSVSWGLEPASATDFWSLGTSTLGSTTLGTNLGPK